MIASSWPRLSAFSGSLICPRTWSAGSLSFSGALALLTWKRTTGLEGTTISHGLVGSWYFKYGIAGIIEGGLLMGLLYSIAERTLNKGTGRPMVIMISLGLLTWLFRCFRDVTFPELWALLLGFMVLTGLIWFGRIFASAKT